MTAGTESMRFAPVEHARAIGKVVGLGVGKLPKLPLLAKERLMHVRAAFDPATPPRSGAGTVAPDAAAGATALRDWTSHEVLDLPAELMDRSSAYDQDVRTAPDRLEVEIEHRVVALAGATAYTNGLTHRSVFDREGRLVPDVSAFRGALPDRPPLPLPPARRVPGRTLNAYGNLAMAGGNYGHWLVDGVAVLLSMRRALGELRFDRVLVPPMFHDFHLDSLALFGVRPEQVIELHPLEVLEFEELVCATAPRGRSSGVEPGWVIDGFRELVGQPAADGPTGRRLYISRRDAPTRDFVNEPDVARLLEARGFETVALSAHSMAGKAALFAQADAIVGLSGAGLMNAMFCRPQCTLLEVHPPRLVTYGIGTICARVGCRYDYLLALDDSVMSRYNRYYGEISLDPDVLAARLDALGLD